MKKVQLLGVIFLITGCNQSDNHRSGKYIEEKCIIDSASLKVPDVLQLDYDTAQWVEITRSSNISLDLRYATNSNFTKKILYPCARCFLRPEVAKAILQAAAILQEQGLSLTLFDCYRPLEVQRVLWQNTPNPLYVTPPSKGSMHNRGLAVDITLASLQGHFLDMGTPFDYFGPEAHRDFMELDSMVLSRRKILYETMELVGLKGIRTEWWHYSMPSIKSTIQDSIWNCPDVM